MGTSCKMLAREDERDVEVTKVDQDDASQEMQLAMEDDCAKLVVGDCFVAVDNDEAEEYVDKKTEVLQAELEEWADKADKCQADMGELKTLLYAKFGKSINLEEDKEE